MWFRKKKVDPGLGYFRKAENWHNQKHMSDFYRVFAQNVTANRLSYALRPELDLINLFYCRYRKRYLEIIREYEAKDKHTHEEETIYRHVRYFMISLRNWRDEMKKVTHGK